jgi:4-diphosphocytidyl-2-C-methyl-D-erythritol kinase
MTLNVTSPAKLNLFLAVGPKDEIGYHPIRSIFQAVGLYDEVLIDLDVNETSVAFEGEEIPERNTVTKAIRLMAEFTELPKMAVHIKKEIPTRAGLGGGSSNAAAVIRAVRHLIPERLSERDAFAVAEAVGADVPFFLVGGKAKAEGYGERLTPIRASKTKTWALIVKPPYSYSTPEMYEKLDAVSYHFADFPSDDKQYNDFERVICYGNDVIERIGVFGGSQCGMTGSGSAMFGLFQTEREAKQAERFVRSEDLGSAWVVPFLTREESLKITVDSV